MPEMKNSRVVWIGDIPKNWSISRGIYLYQITTGKKDAIAEDEEGEYAFFTCSKDIKKTKNYSFDTEALLVAGNGLVGYTQYFKGKFDAYQRTYVLHKFCNIDPQFLKFYVSNNLIDEVTPKSQGSVIQFIKYDDLKCFNVVYPSMQEQRIISAFLNDKCLLIDGLIRDIEKQIAILKQYKTAYIDDCFNSNINIKLGVVGHFQNGSNFTTSDTADSIPFLGVGDFKDKIKISSIKELSMVPISSYITPTSYLKNGDIVFVRSNGSKELVGRSVLIEKIESNVTFSGFCIRFRNMSKDFLNNYLLYFFQSSIFRTEINKGSMGTNINNLSQDVLKNVNVPYVPLVMQEQIISNIEKKINDVDEIINIKTEQINILSNYKKSLIYECVTGKKVVI